MPTTHNMYRQGLLGTQDHSIDWAGAANVAAVLLTSAYTPALTTHSTYGDLSNEVTDADYAPQGVAARAVNLDTATVRYRGNDVIFGTDVTISARYMAFVQGDPANLQAGDRLISLHDLGETKSSTNSDWRVNEPAGGWFAVNEV